MFLAALVLILSTGLLLFYLQAACQRILRRPFDQDYFRAIVNANRLEFPAVRKALENIDPPLDYARLRMMLKCDFLALAYLLRNAANVNQRYSSDEWLLIVYFRLLFVSLFLRRLLQFRMRPAVFDLTAILQYFANVVGLRVNTVRFGNLTASDYLLNI